MKKRSTSGAAFGNPKAVVQNWRIPAQHHGSRADLYLREKIGRISREKCQQLIERGDFRKNNQVLKPAARVHSGDEVCFWRIPPDEKPMQDWSIPILNENANWVILNKPPHIAVHPNATAYYGTITYWLNQRYGTPPPHICHRLDKETSGVIACAKTKPVEVAIKKGFEGNQHQKMYLAICRGQPPEDEFQVHAPLSLQGERGLVRIKMIVDPQGLASSTRFQVLCREPSEDRSLIACFPKTGRQHQIRAHLACAGYPIVADKLYGMGEAFFDEITQHNSNIEHLLEHPRHALHAFALKLDHFDTQFWAPLPADMFTLLPMLQTPQVYTQIGEILKTVIPDIDVTAWSDRSQETQI